ncbi:hypothetical protein C7974DRAFT_132129 [Boeremia exigua]|uniref:uncharacterized protein n=1 Tax=Boeremia exigua TaxID=749465 RepID=UPI001E8EE780|nr:uncharacterized protein C7974DRAFT_132129 [Boeremia exigua]KAH6639468.1 hypothetical protein C7974DRAFT_132129 [Boeremia exigua]
MLDHYRTLEVDPSADLAAIKKAYHNISLLCHPDKTYHLSATERTKREHLFKLASVAFEVLSDPKERRTYDEARVETQSSQGYQPHTPPQYSNQSSSPPRSSSTRSRDAQGSEGIRRAPLSTHRFSISTLGTAPDFNWYHCALSERCDLTSLTYSNWLGWKFSIQIANHFEVVSEPIIPEKPVMNSITIRLAILRRPKSNARASTDIVVEMRGTPGSKHTILSSALIETTEDLELVVDIAIAPEDVQKHVLGPSSWKWAYDIDHNVTTLEPKSKIKVTSLIFHPSRPSMAISPSGGMPGIPYPCGSPMYSLVDLFPGLIIELLAADTYCKEETQSGITFWRLTAFGHT